jgi:threonine synthase
MMTSLGCVECKKIYPENRLPFRCECGGVYDYLDFPPFDPNLIVSRSSGVFRYRNFLGFENQDHFITLGEGNTPLLKTNHPDLEIYLKLETHNPSGSYKDRGTVTLVNQLHSRKVKFAVEDSSGNAGASFAAYCARAGINGRVYIPESASGPKRAQIEIAGVEVVRVPGPRSEAARAVLAAVTDGEVYASHAYMPFGLTGIATIAYEIVEELGEAPGTLIAPIGHGGLLYGMMRGFESMRAAGFIEKEPYYIGVQASGCAPLAEAFKKEETQPAVIEPCETVAEGVKVTAPVRGSAILDRIKGGKGEIVAIDEVTIIKAFHTLARMGVYVEPTSALVWAAIEACSTRIQNPGVAVITGSGYKSILQT